MLVGAVLLSVLSLGVATLACDAGSDSGWDDEYDDEGATDNEQTTGRQERGRDPGDSETVYEWDDEGEELVWSYQLHYSDVILSPDGQNLLSMVPKPGPAMGFEEPGLVLTVQPLPNGKRRVFPQMQDLVRINFSPDGRDAYLLKDGGLEIAVLDLESYTYSGEFYLDKPFCVVDVTPNGQYLILSNLPTTDTAEANFSANSESCTPDPKFGMPPGASLCQAAVVDIAEGHVWYVELPHRARDIDFDPISGELLFTYSKQYSDGLQIKSHVLFYDPSIADFSTKLMFENCADEVVMSPDNELALLSPNDCMIFQEIQDPISVIDLNTREFVTNLPGFGPVSVSPDGSAAVGFTRREVMQQQWSYFDQTKPIGLIFVNLSNLTWKVVDYGDEIPGYTISPDGKYLYVYRDSSGSLQGTLTRYDMKTHTSFKLSGPAVELDQFVWTSSGDKMYFISNSLLHSLSNSSNMIRPIQLDVLPELINIRPQGDYLVLGEKDQPTFYTALIDDLADFLPTEGTFDLGLEPTVNDTPDVE